MTGNKTTWISWFYASPVRGTAQRVLVHHGGISPASVGDPAASSVSRKQKQERRDRGAGLPSKTVGLEGAWKIHWILPTRCRCPKCTCDLQRLHGRSNLRIGKKVNPKILTVAGGQHFTATAQESLEAYPEIDVVVRGEGEQTFVELVQALSDKSSFSKIKGISFRHERKILHNPSRFLIEKLDDLPLPGYHFIEDVVSKYHFKMMAGSKAGYALIEGSRGCPHRCTFCSQWKHWMGKWRIKSPKRIADEMEFCYQNYGTRFLWLTDDNFGLGKHASDLCDEIIRRDISEDIMWFMQVRCDDIVKNQDILPSNWTLTVSL